jgi:hypothetical protein
VKADIKRDMAAEEFRQLQQKVQAEASAGEHSVKQTTLRVDQQLQQINEAVAKLSTPVQLAVSPSATSIPEKSANNSA